MATDKTRLGEKLAALAASADATQADKDAAKAKWIDIAGEILDENKDHAEITCTIPLAAIDTAGSAAAQTGPTALPVDISGTIK